MEPRRLRLKKDKGKLPPPKETGLVKTAPDSVTGITVSLTPSQQVEKTFLWQLRKARIDAKQELAHAEAKEIAFWLCGCGNLMPHRQFDSPACGDLCHCGKWWWDAEPIYKTLGQQPGSLHWAADDNALYRRYVTRLDSGRRLTRYTRYAIE